MNFHEAQDALNHLQKNGLVLPFGQFPGNFPGGGHDSIFVDEASWNAYQWNPPQYLPVDFPAADPDASAKPTWQELLDAAGIESPKVRRQFLLRMIKQICRTRIHEAYGQDNHHDEIELRLGGRHTEAQDTERERLRTRYSIIKAWIESTDRTLAELESLDLTDDANWTGETWPPNRGTL